MSVRAVVVSLRPHQWTKNLVLLAALALSKHLFDPQPLSRALFAFALFCGLSGTVYLLNDVADVERDRLHPTKRLRPIANGDLAVRTAVALALALGMLCVGLSFLLGPTFAACAAIYLVLNLAYSFRLKEVVIYDSTGVAFQDAVASALVYERAIRNQEGTGFHFGG